MPWAYADSAFGLKFDSECSCAASREGVTSGQPASLAAFSMSLRYFSGIGASLVSPPPGPVALMAFAPLPPASIISKEKTRTIAMTKTAPAQVVILPTARPSRVRQRDHAPPSVVVALQLERD